MNRFKRIRYIPIAAAVGVILFLTTQNIQDNAKISEGFRAHLVQFYDALGLESGSAWWNDRLAVRRLCHIIEYGMLGFCSAIAVYDLDRKRKSFLSAVGICLGVSIFDQVLKIFVPVRHFDVIDIGFDLIGTLIGAAVVVAMAEIVGKLRR